MNSVYWKYPAGPQCVWVPLRTTLSWRYRSPYFSCSACRTCTHTHTHTLTLSVSFYFLLFILCLKRWLCSIICVDFVLILFYNLNIIRHVWCRAELKWIHWVHHIKGAVCRNWPAVCVCVCVCVCVPPVVASVRSFPRRRWRTRLSASRRRWWRLGCTGGCVCLQLSAEGLRNPSEHTHTHTHTTWCHYLKQTHLV